jgi:hypothetical protein
MPKIAKTRRKVRFAFADRSPFDFHLLERSLESSYSGKNVRWSDTPYPRQYRHNTSVGVDTKLKHDDGVSHTVTSMGSSFLNTQAISKCYPKLY